MRSTFIAICVGGLLFSTGLWAVAGSTQPAAPKELSPKETLELHQKIQIHNRVFDDHHTGGIPYEHYKK